MTSLTYLLFFYITQIDSMLPCVCSVIDHRWRQNVVEQISLIHSAIASCASFVLTTFWLHLWSINYRTNAWQHGIYLLNRVVFAQLLLSKTTGTWFGLHYNATWKKLGPFCTSFLFVFVIFFSIRNSFSPITWPSSSPRNVTVHVSILHAKSVKSNNKALQAFEFSL